jgi:RND superfamily putative drug exporter
MSSESNSRPVIPRTIRSWAVPIILAWVALTAGLNLLLPQVEIVGEHNAVSMSPQDAPSVIAAKRIGATFQESTSTAWRWWFWWAMASSAPRRTGTMTR